MVDATVGDDVFVQAARRRQKDPKCVCFARRELVVQAAGQWSRVAEHKCN